MNTIYIVIPARFASERLPGKALADIAGKPMISWVAKRASLARSAGVWVATPDINIAQAVEKEGFKVAMTRLDHQSGTERIAEVAVNFGWQDGDIVVNVQGDEPLIDSDLIEAVANALANDKTAAVATAAQPLNSTADYYNPNVVKVVIDKNQYAMYFSRAPIPHLRQNNKIENDKLPDSFLPLRHIGIYAYRVAALKQYAYASPTSLEKWEGLEQLRAMWHGQRILVIDWVKPIEAGVDTPEDLARIKKRFESIDINSPLFL